MFPTKLLVPALLASVVLAAPAVAQDVAYELVNNSGLTLMEFYASPVNQGRWDNDILGANVLPSGAAGVVTIADGGATCAHDLLFVFEDGRTLEDRVDVCEKASYTIN